MILYYLKKLVQFFFPSIVSLLLHYLRSPPVFVELLKTNRTKKKKKRRKGNFIFFKLPLRLSMLQIFLCFFLQMLSPCYALASVAKPISCGRLGCLCRPHHKGTEWVPTIVPYHIPHQLSEEGQIYNSALYSSVLWGKTLWESQLLGGGFFTPGYTTVLVH